VQNVFAITHEFSVYASVMHRAAAAATEQQAGLLSDVVQSWLVIDLDTDIAVVVTVFQQDKERNRMICFRPSLFWG